MKTVERRQAGKVSSWNERRGFGFIESDVPGERDIFVHATGILGRRTLEVGEQVTFEVVESEKGLKAVNVRRAA